MWKVMEWVIFLFEKGRRLVWLEYREKEEGMIRIEFRKMSRS